MKNAVFTDVMPVALLRIDVSEERIASIMKATRIGELGTTSARGRSFLHPDDGSDMLY
jgi:hypothetical protein